MGGSRRSSSGSRSLPRRGRKGKKRKDPSGDRAERRRDGKKGKPKNGKRHTKKDQTRDAATNKDKRRKRGRSRKKKDKSYSPSTSRSSSHGTVNSFADDGMRREVPDLEGLKLQPAVDVAKLVREARERAEADISVALRKAEEESLREVAEKTRVARNHFTEDAEAKINRF